MKLLYAIDIRDEDLWHLDEVTNWATRLDATVDLVYVNPFGDYAPYVLDPQLNKALREGVAKAKAADLAIVQKAMSGLPEAIRGTCDVLSGDAAPELAEHAQGYDALLLSTRANKGLKRLWLGSIAERVLRMNKGTTIVLHGRD